MNAAEARQHIDGRVEAFLRRWGAGWPTGREIADSLRLDLGVVRRSLVRLETAGRVRRGGTGQDTSAGREILAQGC